MGSVCAVFIFRSLSTLNYGNLMETTSMGSFSFHTDRVFRSQNPWMVVWTCSAAGDCVRPVMAERAIHISQMLMKTDEFNQNNHRWNVVGLVWIVLSDFCHWTRNDTAVKACWSCAPCHGSCMAGLNGWNVYDWQSEWLYSSMNTQCQQAAPQAMSLSLGS